MENNIQEIEAASKIIKEGGLVIFPTETVYGIGANGLDKNAVSKIFEVKGRKTDNPLILHITDYKMLSEITEEVTPLEQKLMDAFWPGPLTIILKKKDIVPNIVSANLNTVGVRMPKSEIARSLISSAGVPIAAPSANISGKPSGTNLEDIKAEFNGKVDYFINGGDTEVGLESTVIIVINETVRILRPGKITKEDFLSVTDKVEVDSHVLSKPDDGPVLSPGMKYRHYAPSTPCMLIYSEDENKLINTIKEELKKYNSCLVLTKSSHTKYFDNSISYGESLEEISHNIFRVLRQVDKYKVDIVIIEGVTTEGLGLAIMNRLLRACSYNYIEIK